MFLKKVRHRIHYIFDNNEAENKIQNFGNIGYRSMNGRYIRIGPKKVISVDR